MEHFDAEWRPLPDYNADSRGTVPAVRHHAGPRPRVGEAAAQVRAALPDPPDWLLERRRGLFARATAEGWQANGGFVYTTDHEGRRSCASGCTGSSTEAIGAAATLHAVTGEASTSAVPNVLGLRGAPSDRPRARELARELDEMLPPRRRRPGAAGRTTYHAFQAALIPDSRSPEPRGRARRRVGSAI